MIAIFCRVLDGAPATIEVLADIVDAVNAQDRKVEVYMDGGVRRGLDIYRALAIGTLIHHITVLWNFSNPFYYPAGVNLLIFQPLEVVSRYRDPHPQVVENYSYLFNLKTNIFNFYG